MRKNMSEWPKDPVPASSFMKKQVCVCGYTCLCCIASVLCLCTRVKYVCASVVCKLVCMCVIWFLCLCVCCMLYMLYVL